MKFVVFYRSTTTLTLTQDMSEVESLFYNWLMTKMDMVNGNILDTFQQQFGIRLLTHYVDSTDWYWYLPCDNENTLLISKFILENS